MCNAEDFSEDVCIIIGKIPRKRQIWKPSRKNSTAVAVVRELTLIRANGCNTLLALFLALKMQGAYIPSQ